MDERQSAAGEDQSTPRDGEPAKAESAMRARTWAIAASRDPAEYDIPELPVWRRLDAEGSGIAFAGADRTEPFISARRPVTVRR